MADTFTTSGFSNWKNALGKAGGLTKHAASQSHLLSAKNHESFKRVREANSNVINKLDHGRVIQIRKNRDRLIKICSTLHLLARQMISFRGHDENNRYIHVEYCPRNRQE